MTSQRMETWKPKALPSWKITIWSLLYTHLRIMPGGYSCDLISSIDEYDCLLDLSICPVSLLT